MSTADTELRAHTAQSGAAEANLHAQMEIYALELRKAVETARSHQSELEPALAQLRTYAHDLHQLRGAQQRNTQGFEHSGLAVLTWLVGAVNRRDGESAGHAQRVARYSRIFAEALGMGASECALIEVAAQLHDAGRVEWPDTILLKRGPLSAEERAAIEAHCGLAQALSVAPSPQMQLAADVIAHHHEHWDGSGYPHGLRGDAIPLAARIVQLADVYDTLRTAFRYKATQSHAAACRAILQGDRRVSPSHFDPGLLDAFGQAAARLADPAAEPEEA